KSVAAPTTQKPLKAKDVVFKKTLVAVEDECFHCKKIGHWKRNCPVYLKDLAKAKGSIPSTSGAK
ncbi:hypothetical protein LINPERPRIM_LOCUS22425, partial [Linum perenne]